ncbi:hypothetical protein Sjap_006538 [Stephania japonica]|uniref:Uncharacterized protein n=1 Tax=Stephania japonica TaxID=461633 RepID=A0AAP0PM24_9MAGN
MRRVWRFHIFNLDLIVIIVKKEREGNFLFSCSYISFFDGFNLLPWQVELGLMR